MSYSRGGIIRGDSTRKAPALVFTGDEFADGGQHIANTLKAAGVKANFFFTGRFYRNPAFAGIIRQLKRDGHYRGRTRTSIYCTATGTGATVCWLPGNSSIKILRIAIEAWHGGA
ncbi:hypothetical protein MKQ70_25950 [Chitinophaga sedimenti]|uniref:hypothetical protein n=1 Tax=Chitinophaga sedimenti TaxID=2033606 RepID=UPI002004B887|nr:hypothetical protein [Chitinophaga sedimenti]MCK7558258.1 hypothetical protein [Chitinophaga sedimenti]